MRMSKKILLRVSRLKSVRPGSRARMLALLLSLLALFMPAISLTSAQRPAPGREATSSAARNAALVATTNEVLKETSELRELAVLRPVQSSAQSRAEIERMVVNNLDRETTPAQLHATEVTLKRLGLAPADFKFRALIIGLLTEQVAGYYDPKAQQFHLADWIDIDGQKPVMAHELTHALQDQHFDLRRFEHWPKGDSDAELAAHALIEGDATLTMSLYVARSPLRALAFLKSLGTTGMATHELDKAPRAVRESLLFPYQEGLNWSRVVHRYGGWTKVSAAFKNLPLSTEQILHADKYFIQEKPVKVSLPDITVKARKRPSVLSDWKRIDFDVNGEWGFYLILDQFLKSPAESRQAAAGWGGDAYSVYESRNGEAFYVSLSSWDTEKDARELFDAYVKRTQMRYPNAEPLSSDRAGARMFGTAEGGVVVEIRGSRVMVMEGLPKNISVRSLTQSLSWPN